MNGIDGVMDYVKNTTVQKVLLTSVVLGAGLAVSGIGASIDKKFLGSRAGLKRNDDFAESAGKGAALGLVIGLPISVLTSTGAASTTMFGAVNHVKDRVVENPYRKSSYSIPMSKPLKAPEDFVWTVNPASGSRTLILDPKYGL